MRNRTDIDPGSVTGWISGGLVRTRHGIRHRPDISIVQGKVYAADMFIVDCSSPFTVHDKRLIIDKTFIQRVEPRECNHKNRKSYVIQSPNQKSLYSLFNTKAHNLNCHSLFTTTRKSSSINKTLALAHLMETLYDPEHVPHRGIGLDRIKTALVVLLKMLVESYAFDSIIVDDIALGKLLPEEQRDHVHEIHPCYTKPSLMTPNIRKQDHFKKIIIDKIVRGHGGLPIGTIPHPVLAALSPSQTDLSERLALVNIKKRRPVLLLSAMNTAWAGYMAYSLPLLGYSEDVLPVSIFRVPFWYRK